MKAVLVQSLELVQKLLAHGAGLDLQDSEGHTALSLAINKLHCIVLTSDLVSNGNAVLSQAVTIATHLYLESLEQEKKIVIHSVPDFPTTPNFFVDPTVLNLTAIKTALIHQEYDLLSIQDSSGLSPLQFIYHQILELLKIRGSLFEISLCMEIAILLIQKGFSLQDILSTKPDIIEIPGLKKYLLILEKIEPNDSYFPRPK